MAPAGVAAGGVGTGVAAAEDGGVARGVAAGTAVDPGLPEGVGLGVGAADVIGRNVDSEAAGGGVAPDVAAGAGVAALAPGVLEAGVGSPHAIASTIKIIIALERIQPFFIVFSIYLLHMAPVSRRFHKMGPVAVFWSLRQKPEPRCRPLVVG